MTAVLIFVLVWLAVEWSPWVAAGGMVVTAAIGSAATIAVSRRQNSGSVDATDARTLWEQLRTDNIDLRAELKAVKTEGQAEVAQVKADSQRAIAAMETRHHAEMNDARDEINGLRRRVRELEERLDARQ